MIVTGASALPSTRSSAPGAAGPSAPRALESPPEREATKPSMAKVNQILRMDVSKLLDVDATAWARPMQPLPWQGAAGS